MLDLIKHSGPRVTILASKKLSQDDYQDLVPKLESILKKEGKLRAEIVLQDFEGWTIKGLWEELKFDLKHRKSFDRVAVLGDARWQEWGTKISSPFFGGEIRFFPLSDVTAAKQWLDDAESGHGEQDEVPVAGVQEVDL